MEIVPIVYWLPIVPIIILFVMYGMICKAKCDIKCHTDRATDNTNNLMRELYKDRTIELLQAELARTRKCFIGSHIQSQIQGLHSHMEHIKCLCCGSQYHGSGDCHKKTYECCSEKSCHDSKGCCE